MCEVDATQLNLVLKHLREKPLSSWQAIELYGATRLSAIIWVLIHKRHINVQSRWVHGINRYGNESRWKEYYIEE